MPRSLPVVLLLLLLGPGEQGRPEHVIAAVTIALDVRNRDPASPARRLGRAASLRLSCNLNPCHGPTSRKMTGTGGYSKILQCQKTIREMKLLSLLLRSSLLHTGRRPWTKLQITTLHHR